MRIILRCFWLIVAEAFDECPVSDRLAGPSRLCLLLQIMSVDVGKLSGGSCFSRSYDPNYSSRVAEFIEPFKDRRDIILVSFLTCILYSSTMIPKLAASNAPNHREDRLNHLRRTLQWLQLSSWGLQSQHAGQITWGMGILLLERYSIHLCPWRS